MFSKWHLIEELSPVGPRSVTLYRTGPWWRCGIHFRARNIGLSENESIRIVLLSELGLWRALSGSMQAFRGNQRCINVGPASVTLGQH